MKNSLTGKMAWMGLMLFLLVGVAVPGWAQEERPRRGAERRTSGPQENEAEKAKDKDKKDEPDKKTPVTAIVGGDIITVTGPTIRKGTLLIQDGKILELGQNVTVPEGATTIDATGRTITPGFVAISMQGVGIRSTPGNRDKLEDGLDPFDRNMKYSLGVGITTGCVELSTGGGRGRRRPRVGEAEERFPGLDPEVEQYVTEAILDYGDINTSLCPCCGLPVLPTEPITPAPPAREQPRSMSVIKLSYANLDAMLLKEDVFYSPAPGALNGALNRHNWRRDILKAKEAVAEEAKAKSQPAPGNSPNTSGRSGRSGGGSGPATGGRPASGGNNSSGVSEDLKRLVKGEIAMRVRANTADEIRDMVALAKELGYRVVIEGGIEAWVVADEMGAAKASVIYTPRQRREPQPGREDTSGSSIESTRLFQETGIPFATAALSNSVSMGGLAGRDLTSLPLEAAFAVRGGVSDMAALESITITPAKMMGLEDRIGSLEVGKDADILILNGSPLDYRTYVEKAIVAGKVSYDRSEDRVYPVYDRN